MILDFTLDKYAELCKALKSLSCPITTVRSFLGSERPSNFSVILRHDVDRGIDAALRMAELEADMDITATYYIRIRPGVFKPEALKRLHHLRHEVGYHYEVLAKTKGDKAQAIALFERELERFREIVPIETISMHGSPLSRWNNLDLWQAYRFENYGLKDAILSTRTEEMFYFTDTGRCWDADRYNVRDRVTSLKPTLEIHTTDDLLNLLSAKSNVSIYINTHPNRWAVNRLDWIAGAIFDWTVNRTKFVIQGLLSLRSR
jgi:hypothetical protein